VRYCHTIVRRVLQDAAHQGLVSRNVATLTNPPSANAAKESAERARHTWNPAQLAAFLQHVREHRLVAAFVLLATTGARRGEILGLRWSDVNLAASRLTIRQTVVVVGRELQFGTPKTRAGRRTIALDQTSVLALREHRKQQLEERLALGIGQSELVFCREDGRPLYPSTFSNTFVELVAASGLPKIRLHDLRHTWASLALAAGVPAKNVSERLGHSGIAITLDIYTHTTPDQDEQAAQAVANLVFGDAPH
jgi:integrase